MMRRPKPWGFRNRSEYVELDNLEHRGSTLSQQYPERPWYRSLSLETWRPVVWCGVGTSAVVLIANFAVLMSGLPKPADGPGTRILYDGDCGVSSRTYTGWHILINVLSTLLLGASNAASQILAAPSREEVDGAHAKGRYVHIGVFDFLNLRFITAKRVILCALIALSSIPLHLLYNSAIFNTISVYNYFAFMVAPDFLTGGNVSFATPSSGPYHNTTYYYYGSLDLSQSGSLSSGSSLSGTQQQKPYLESRIFELQQQAQRGKLERKSPRDCILQFGQDTVSTASAVIMVAKNASAPLNSTILGTYQYHTPLTMETAYPEERAYEWLCNDADFCDAKKQASANPWVLQTDSRSSYFNGGGYGNRYYEVDYCLVRKAQPHCTVNLSIQLMVTVIVCNGIKLACFLTCLTVKEHKPLVTVGDAVCSFMTNPDTTTAGLGAVSNREIRHGSWEIHKEAIDIAQKQLPGKNLVFPGKPWKNKRHKYFAAVGVGRWVSTGLLCFFVFLAGMILLILGTMDQNWGAAAFKAGFTFSPAEILSGDFTLFSAVLIANILQLAISNAYLLYNGVFTCVLLSSELADYATEAKSMRVTRPRAGQRSTYWLQLPYRWSLPLMGVMTLLHWLVSEAIFMVAVKVNDPDGVDMAEGIFGGSGESFYGLAWGPTAALCAVLEGAAMIIFLFANGFRKFPAGIPILSSNSAAISSACHPSEQEYKDVTLRPLRYGVLETDASRDPKPTGFSARAVAPLLEGEKYGGKPDLDDDDDDSLADSLQEEIRAPSPLVPSDATTLHPNGSSGRDYELVPISDGQPRARSRPGRKIASTPKFM